MKSLRDLARETTVVSELMQDKDKVDVAYIIEKYPEGVTLNGVDVLSGEGGSKYPVFTILEDETVFFFGGIVLMHIVESWLQAMGGDIKIVSEALGKEPVRVKLGSAKTKANKNVTTVEVLD